MSTFAKRDGSGTPGCGTNSHSYFVAETVAVEAEGKVVLLGLCVRCKDPLMLEFQVCQPGSGISSIGQ